MKLVYLTVADNCEENRSSCYVSLSSYALEAVEQGLESRRSKIWPSPIMARRATKILKVLYIDNISPSKGVEEQIGSREHDEKLRVEQFETRGT